MSLADRLPAVVSLVLCGHLAAVLGYSGAFSGLLMHDSPWFAYIGRVYIFALAAVFGMTMWVTFVAGITMFRVLPGPMFAAVQSKLFPMYFNFQVVCFLHVSLCWLVRYGSNGQTMNLAVGLLASVMNFGILGPLQVKALAARTKAERSQEEAKTEAEKSRATAAYLAAKKRFGKLHGMSMLANFVVVGVLCWHLVVVGGGIF